MVVVVLLGVWPAVRASRVRIGGDRAVEEHPSVHRVESGCHGSAAERGDRSPSRLGTRARRRLASGRHRAVRIGVGGHGAVRHGRLRRQFDAPHGYSRALRQQLPVGILELQTGGRATPPRGWPVCEHDHSITAIMLVATDEVSINGHDVLALAGKTVRGPMLLSKVDGRLPTGEHDMTLGVTTLHQVGAHVGSVLGVTVQLPSGGSRTVPFRVVGTASFPSDAGGGGLGSGSAFTMAGYLTRRVSTRSRATSLPRGVREQSGLRRLGEGGLRSERVGPLLPATSLRTAPPGRPSQPRWSTSGRR